jgi:hypothetical protein
MPAKISAAEKRQLKKQAACPHPTHHVHSAIDPRWETCDLCHIVGRAPLNAPWIVAYDEEQPAPAPLQLFADYTGEEVMPERPKTRARSR